jgi:hypothetical protein
VRAACAWVAARARHVHIDERAIGAYARGLVESRTSASPSEPAAPGDPAAGLADADRETRAAFAVCLNAINFGSGWWPTIRKRPGQSGFFTVAAGVADRFRERGAWTADELTALDVGAIATTLGQDPEHPLMSQFAASLNDVGTRLRADHDGSFERLVDAAAGSAPALAGELATWSAFADTSTYEGRPVPFFKRAQLTAADLDRAGVARLAELDRLTAFADNLVPHVLRVDAVLHLDPKLRDRIEAERLLDHGSPEEVELRAAAVHAIELLSAATDARLSPATIDQLLWNRGRAPRYKALPRPRCRTTAY